MSQRAMPHGKMPAGNDGFYLRALCAGQSRMLLLRRKEINGLSVKTDEVSESFFKMPKLRVKMSLTLKLKG